MQIALTEENSGDRSHLIHNVRYSRLLDLHHEVPRKRPIVPLVSALEHEVDRARGGALGHCQLQLVRAVAGLGRELALDSFVIDLWRESILFSVLLSSLPMGRRSLAASAAARMRRLELRRERALDGLVIDLWRKWISVLLS